MCPLSIIFAKWPLQKIALDEHWVVSNFCSVRNIINLIIWMLNATFNFCQTNQSEMTNFLQYMFNKISSEYLWDLNTEASISTWYNFASDSNKWKKS